MRAFSFLLPVLFIVSLSQASCTKDEITDTTPVLSTLSEEEENDLRLMREEEKLARDVYLYAYDLYGTQIFSNISNAEQTHMDRILDILIKYDIKDPAVLERGVFNNPTLQILYNDLTDKCDISLLDALTVGATIEDLDIYDLDHCISNTSNTDLLVVFESLNCGSRNHMRAFMGQIKGLGSDYTPQFISLADFNSILDGDHEKCGQH